MVFWTVSQAILGWGVITSILWLTHSGKSPDERLSVLRFCGVLGVALILPVVVFIGLPFEVSNVEVIGNGIGGILVDVIVALFSGFIYGSIGMILYAVASGLPNTTTTA